MRIVSWNCGGGFRSKFNRIDELQFDVCIIQECENPSDTPIKAYKNWATNYLWVGENRNKGIGVFCKNNTKITKLNYPDGNNKFFLPFSIDEQINVIAVWTKNSPKVADSYIGQMWNYLQLNEHQIEFDRCLFIGDLNSNSIWDTMRTGGNHRTVVELLKSKDVHSIYHHKYNEEHGLESSHTFFMHRHLDKGFHIDYSFASSAIIKKLQNFQIGKKEEWLNDSDHLPMIVDLKD